MKVTLHQQIERAFDYRGNVTIRFNDGTNVDGFIYNRAFSREGGAPQKDLIEVFLAGSGEAKAYAISEISSVEMTGEDHAAGKSYEEWSKKHPRKD